MNIPGAGGAAVAGLKYGPASGVPSSANVAGLGYAIIYAGNVGWSQPSTDLITGPSSTHHITAVSFPAKVQLTTVFKDATFTQTECTMRVNVDLANPYPGTAYPQSYYGYWYAGTLTATIA